MPRYSRDSGHFWLGELPTVWSVVRGKDLFRKVSLPVRDEDEVVTCFRDGVTTLRKNRREDGFTFALKEIGYQGVRTGHLVVHAMDAFAGAIGIADADGKCSPVYSVCAPKYQRKTYLPYYAWVLRNMATAGYIQSVAKGIRERSTDFRYSEVEEAQFALPSHDEQRRITAWLNLQTRRIDKRLELLDKKRELLRALRKSVIHEAVAGAAEGTTVRVKNVAAINPPTRLPKTGLVQFFPMDSIGIDGGLSFAQEKDVSVASGFSQFRNGDVLFAKVTPCFENGKSAVGENLTGCGALATTEVTVLRPTKTVLAQFLHYRIKGQDFADMGVNEMKGAGGLKRVPEKQVANFYFRLPDIGVQRRIVEYLDKKTAHVDKQIDFIDRLEALLKEQRKAIIHEAVTGKIDLSDYEPPAQAA